MPTVYVSAQTPELAAIQQVQDAFVMAAAKAEAASLRMEAARPRVDAAPALRTDAMPR
jgi:hypothetical protein